MDDEPDSQRWVTYKELAAARGITSDSATRLAFRRKWRRQVGNDGIARTLVPVSEAKRAKTPALGARGGVTHDGPHDGIPDISPDATPDIGRMINVFEASLSTLREQLARERDRADGAEARAARAEAQAAAESVRATAAEARADSAEATIANTRASWAGRLIRALRLGRSRRPAARSTPESGPQR